VPLDLRGHILAGLDAVDLDRTREARAPQR